jgi:lysophospholipase L1-like esterase
MSRLSPSPPAPGQSSRGVAIVAGLLAVALIAGFGIGWLALTAAGGGDDATSVAEASATASATPLRTASVAGSEMATPTSTPTSTPTATTSTPTAATSATPDVPPPLPAMLAAVGDSYSQAYSVAPGSLYDHPQYSWVVGTAKSDGVTSLLEHLRAAGASPTVVDAATSGKKMVDAPRQALEVVAAAANLEPGKTVYVTFELGTNDLCDDPKTSIADFTDQLDTAIETLQVGLPRGSRLLMMAVPDFRHFRDITQADPVTKAAFLEARNASRCAPFLGANSQVSLEDAGAILDGYNAALEAACARLNSATGASAHLQCTWNLDLLSERDFGVMDLSRVDYFHPSLSGQAKMAAAAWKADVWGR